MPNITQPYEFIEKKGDLDRFYQLNKDIEWLAFDTEFVGEKRFFTRICLLQIATEKGNYLIDPFKLGHLKPLQLLLERPDIVKITHAGDNDYRLLNTRFGLIPQNVFDTQVAAGFLGYKYPVSFRKLVEGELNIYLKKGYAVADWESRPFRKNQLTYALNDVLPLFDLWQSLRAKLVQQNRLHWAEEEFQKWTKEMFYYRDPHLEALKSNLIRSLNPKQRIFLIRLYEWRRKLAEEKNHSKEMVLSSKLIGQIVRSIQAGQDALKQNRRIPDKISKQYGSLFESMYNKKATQAERLLLDRIPEQFQDSPQREIMIEMLFLLVKYRCLQNGVSPSMVVSKNTLQKATMDISEVEDLLRDGWRKELLGDTIINWLQNMDHLGMDIKDGLIELKLNGQEFTGN